MSMPAADRSLGVIHTVTGLVPVFDELVSLHLPGWKPFNIVDESLLRNTIREGELSQATMRRVAGYVWSAVDAGAQAILVTCSSIGPAVDAVGAMCPVPLVRVDLGMVERALDTGNRLGVLATLSTTLGPTAELVQRRAALRQTDVTVTSHLCAGAFERLSAGDKAGHDAAIVAGVEALAGKVDVIILAQASMARALTERKDFGVPIYSSPELGVLNLRRMLAAE